MTVLSSGSLPITICKVDDADWIYNTLLGSRLLGVPRGGPARLAQWPMLKPHSEILELHGSGLKQSCGDILLSSAGWFTGMQYVKHSLWILYNADFFENAVVKVNLE
jgi:hypothetical protein